MRMLRRPRHADVGEPDAHDAAFARCRSEALQAFGNGDLYVEEVLGPRRGMSRSRSLATGRAR